MSRFGIKDYQSISKLLPDNKSNYLHKKNRHNWPNQCREVIKLLSKKNELLNITPQNGDQNFLLQKKKI